MTESQRADRRFAGARDALDDRLIALLCDDARMTLTALAQKLSLSRTAVQARMARLERDGVIAGYRAVLGARADPAADEGLEAILGLTYTQRPCAPVVAGFRQWPEVTRYYSVTGPVDGYLVARVAGAAELSALVDRLSAHPGVGAVISAVVLKRDVS